MTITIFDTFVMYLLSDCRASCHPDCKDSLPLPCIPTAPSTPGGTKLSGVSLLTCRLSY